MRIDKLCELFIRNSELRGNEPGTNQSYRDRLRVFRETFGRRKVNSLTLDELLMHFADEIFAMLSDSTKRSNIMIIRQMMRFAIDREYLKKPWWKRGDLQMPKQGVREKFLTPEQTAEVLKHLRPSARSIYRVLRLTAARPGEMCRAMIANLEGETGHRVIVLAKHKTARKTGKPRRIVLSPAAEMLVAEAIGDREDGPIFRTSRGNPWIRDRLSREFRRVRDLLGIDRRVVLYSARHEGATLIVEQFGIAAAKEQLGHEDIKTTQRYAHPAESVTRHATATAIQDIKPREAA